MTEKPHGWELVQQGKFAEAIARFYEQYAEDGGTADYGPVTYLFGVSTAYLLMDQPMEAAKVAETMLPRRHVGTAEYALAGTAHWIGGDYERAISHWKKGRGAQYADASGGMELPLLLFYASTCKPKLIEMDEVRELVKKQQAHPWASCWPGPLGAFILGEISEEKIRERARFIKEEVTRRQMLQVEFYLGVKAFYQGDKKKFKAKMKQYASSPGCECENEFYLARREVAPNH
jgi:hypothetical protein